MQKITDLFTAEEMTLAQQIQSQLFPKSFPFPDKLDIAALYKPSKNIGGDFYDVIQMDDRKVAFLIGDISGHSIPAAIFMAQCHTLLKALLRMDLSLLKIVETANSVLYGLAKADMFATLFVGIYDATFNQLTYVNAGHPPPFLVRSAWEIPSKNYLPHSWVPISSLTAQGMALNCKPAIDLEEKKIQLMNGDILFLYTDGLTEAPNNNHVPLGEGPIKTILSQSKKLTAKDISQKISETLSNHCNLPEICDDVCALIIKMKEKIS